MHSSATKREVLYKIEQIRNAAQTTLNTLPSTTLLLEALRPLEKRLESLPALTPFLQYRSSPLWFYAQTQRDTYLWRQGLSIADEQYFQFWIDVPRLITKCAHLLSGDATHNPFCNPSWGEENAPPIQQELTERYLEAVHDEFEKIAPYLHAWCLACTEVSESPATKRVVVLLPTT
jgi:hypothetical protein